MSKKVVIVGSGNANQFNDPRTGSNPGGTSQGIGFGPYTLAPGESIRIVLAESASGLSREMCYIVGQNWKNQTFNSDLPNSSSLHTHMMNNYHRSTNDNNLYKNSWVFTGADSIVSTFKRAKYNFDLDWPMDMKTTNVSVTVGGQELLRSQFSYSNIKDATKGYDRYFGRIVLTEPPAVSTAVVVSYLKDIDLLQAQDRINLAYNPATGQYAKDLGQLMDGIDYGGVEVKSFDFGGLSGWDTAPYYTGAYDTYDTSFEDEVIKLDGSTITLQLSKALENGVVYNAVSYTHLTLPTIYSV